jgi:hypothetical protein
VALLFAPALIALLVILSIQLKDHFANKNDQPMLDQIERSSSL